MGLPSTTPLEKSFTQWSQDTFLGQYIRDMEISYFNQMAQDVFGFRALQIGMAAWPCLEQSRILCCDTVSRVGSVQLYADGCILPFPENSIDLLVAPHGFDLSPHPHQMARELFRVLRPEGRLIITGFNPFSLWGIRRWFGQKRVPWNLGFLSLPRIKDWFGVLGMELYRGAFMGYRLPTEPKHAITDHHKSILEPMGDRWWPHISALYGLEAIKKVHGVHRLSPSSWHQQTSWVPSLGLRPATPRSTILRATSHHRPGGRHTEQVSTKPPHQEHQLQSNMDRD